MEDEAREPPIERRGSLAGENAREPLAHVRETAAGAPAAGSASGDRAPPSEYRPISSESDGSQSLASATSGSPGGSLAPRSDRRGLRFVLLSHPTVQALRFLSKIGLAWFLTKEEFGEAALAGLILFGAAHLSIFGLDEALIYARTLDARLWRRMRALQNRLGIALSLTAVAAGSILGATREHPLLGHLVLALSPTVWCANLSVLPTALLVRQREYKKVFLVDLVQVLSLSFVSLALAALGCGAWALVGGWYANAIAAVVSSRLLARSLMPAGIPAGMPAGAELPDQRAGEGERGAAAAVGAQPGDDWPHTRRYGLQLTGAAALTYGVERLDSLAVGIWLGRAALGLYELALPLSQAMLNYAVSLVERFLFPALASEHRAARLGDAWLASLRFTLLFVLPAHILLSVMARPFVVSVLPESWQGAAPLLALLALASAGRCADIVAVTALKAAGESALVFKLGLARLALLALALAFTLPHGLVAVTAGVVCGRALAALVSLVLAARVCLPREARIATVLGAAGWVLALWIGAFLASSAFLTGRFADSPVSICAALPFLAILIWALLRLLMDRTAFLAELTSLLAHARSMAHGATAHGDGG